MNSAQTLPERGRFLPPRPSPRPKVSPWTLEKREDKEGRSSRICAGSRQMSRTLRKSKPHGRKNSGMRWTIILSVKKAIVTGGLYSSSLMYRNMVERRT